MTGGEPLRYHGSGGHAQICGYVRSGDEGLDGERVNQWNSQVDANRRERMYSLAGGNSL
jgi:hypothetical protein